MEKNVEFVLFKTINFENMQYMLLKIKTYIIQIKIELSTYLTNIEN